MDAQKNGNGANEGENTKLSITLIADAKFSHIPGDIARDILLRLPVKSLLRCKAVCKSWRSLISNPQFVKSHVNLGNKGLNVNYVHLVRDNWNYPGSKRIEHGHFVSVTSIVNNNNISSSSSSASVLDIKVVEIAYPFEISWFWFNNFLLGSCNGLLLISTNTETYLWNPSTGKYRTTLPINNVWETHHRYVSGLGYDSSLDQYKAVIFFISGEKSHRFVFSSRTGYWKEVDVVGDDDDLPCSIYNHSSCLVGLTVNGTPHWVVNVTTEDDQFYYVNRIIIYFDMAEEKFKKLATPTMPWWNDDHVDEDVTVFEGCLSVVHYNVDEDSYDIWAMKEYGVTESWTKLFGIRYTGACSSLMPLGFVKNGDEVVLLVGNYYLATYNFKTEKNKILTSINHECRCRISCRINVVAAYVESLVSPWWNWEKIKKKWRRCGEVVPVVAKKKTEKKVVNPLFDEKRPKKFGIGGALPPKKDLTTFVRWPHIVRIQRKRRILKQRLKVPPALNQFTKPLDKNVATSLFKLLLKYRPEDKAAKKERLAKKAQAEADGKNNMLLESRKPIVVKYGINHITYLIEQNKAQLVIIAHDVDPIELVVWLPALCRKMEVPYAIVKGKSRLGAIVHKKTATALCLTSIKKEDKLEFSNIVAKAVEANFNDKYNECRKKWGGGIMSSKSQVKTEKKEILLVKEAAERRTSFK